MKASREVETARPFVVIARPAGPKQSMVYARRRGLLPASLSLAVAMTVGTAPCSPIPMVVLARPAGPKQSMVGSLRRGLLRPPRFARRPRNDGGAGPCPARPFVVFARPAGPKQSMAGSPTISPTSSSRPGMARFGLSRPRGASISRTRRNGAGSSNGAKTRRRPATWPIGRSLSPRRNGGPAASPRSPKRRRLSGDERLKFEGLARAGDDLRHRRLSHAGALNKTRTISWRLLPPVL